jgi:hypothetical protein
MKKPSQKKLLTVAIILLIVTILIPAVLQAQNSMVVAPGCNVVVPGTLVLRNTDLVADGSVDAATGTVLFKGTGNNSIGGTTAPVIGTMVVDKPAGLSLNNDVQVITLIDLQNGIITLNGNTIALASSAMLQSENESNRVAGTSGGSITASMPAVNNPNQLDMGNLGAIVTSSANLGDLTIRRSHIVANTPGQMSIQRSYQIDPQNNTALNATLRFHYFDAELNGADENTLVLWESPDNISWTQTGYDIRNTTANYVEKTGIGSFSYWTLAMDANPLPLSLVYFKATCQGQQALIEWGTENETGIDRFEIEKSADAIAWNKVHETEAANEPGGAQYSWQDADPLPRAWYRIRMIDHAGQTSYSPVFSGGCEDIGRPFMLFPNPADKLTTAAITVRKGGASVIQVYDAAGAKILSAQWELKPGANEFPMSLSALSAGTYMVRLLFGSETFDARLIKL